MHNQAALDTWTLIGQNPISLVIKSHNKSSTIDNLNTQLIKIQSTEMGLAHFTSAWWHHGKNMSLRLRVWK